jgi:hypothetical protein
MWPRSRSAITASVSRQPASSTHTPHHMCAQVLRRIRPEQNGVDPRAEGLPLAGRAGERRKRLGCGIRLLRGAATVPDRGALSRPRLADGVQPGGPGNAGRPRRARPARRRQRRDLRRPRRRAAARRIGEHREELGARDPTVGVEQHACTEQNDDGDGSASTTVVQGAAFSLGMAVRQALSGCPRAIRPQSAAKSIPATAVNTASRGGKLRRETLAIVPTSACTPSSAMP